MTDKPQQRYDHAQKILEELCEVTPKEYHMKILCVAGTLGEFKGLSEGQEYTINELKRMLTQEEIRNKKTPTYKLVGSNL